MTTASRPFTAKAERPEWQTIYDALLSGASFGDIISYDSLSRVLGRDFLANRSPVYKARIHLGEMERRWLEVIPGKGYRVIEAREHIHAAQKHKRRAKRQLGMMMRVTDATDIARLTPSELAKFDSQQKLNALLFMVAVRHERRLARIEEILRKEGRL